MLDGTTGKALSIAKAKAYAKENNLVMLEGNEVIYREEQRFSLWLRWLVVLSIVSVSVLSLRHDGAGANIVPS